MPKSTRLASALMILISAWLLASSASAQAPWPHEDPNGWGLAIIDVETTGLDPHHHEMIDIGAIYITLEGEVLGEFFVRIHPQYPERAGEIARSINGYDEDRWQTLNALMPAEAVDQFLAFHQEMAKDRRFVLTAYNAPFDRNFLEALLKRHDQALSDLYTYFVLDLPSMAFGLGVRALVNSDVAAAFGLPPETDNSLEHTGLSGARWNVELYRAMRTHAQHAGQPFPNIAGALEAIHPSAKQASDIEWLFVHTAAHALLVEDRQLAVALDRPILAFTDRPERRVKHLSAAQFVSLWSAGQANGFDQDPPNAVVSWVSQGQMHQAQVEVVAAVFDEEDRRIHYTFREALKPSTSDHVNVAVFFDAMPTPVNGQITQAPVLPEKSMHVVSIFFDGMPAGMDAYL